MWLQCNVAMDCVLFSFVWAWLLLAHCSSDLVQWLSSQDTCRCGCQTDTLCLQTWSCVATWMVRWSHRCVRNSWTFAQLYNLWQAIPMLSLQAGCCLGQAHQLVPGCRNPLPALLLPLVGTWQIVSCTVGAWLEVVVRDQVPCRAHLCHQDPRSLSQDCCRLECLNSL